MTPVNQIDDLNRKLDRLMMDPDNAELYNTIGTILCQVKDWGNAEHYLRRAYALNPSDRGILYNYAGILYLRQKYRKAASVCRAGLKLDPTDPGLLEKLSDICYLQGEYEEAAKAYTILRKPSDKVGVL